MGYRSSWYLAIEGETAEKTAEAIKNRTLPKYVLEMLDYVDNENEDNKQLYFEQHGIKMYNHYPEIAALYNWLDGLDEEDFMFYEVGEEDGDITSKGINHDLLYVSTTVERYQLSIS